MARNGPLTAPSSSAWGEIAHRNRYQRVIHHEAPGCYFLLVLADKHKDASVPFGVLALPRCRNYSGGRNTLVTEVCAGIAHPCLRFIRTGRIAAAHAEAASAKSRTTPETQT